MKDRTMTFEDLKVLKSKNKQLKTGLDYVDSLKINQGFNPGEVILAKYRDKDKYLMLDWQSNKPQKFYIVCIEEGVIFASKITSTGLIGKAVFAMNVTYPSKTYEFVGDPEFADYIILGEEGLYDPTKEGKLLNKVKVRIRNYNKKIELDVNTRSVLELDKFLAKRAVGTHFWTCSDKIGGDRIRYEIVGKVDHKTSRYGSSRGKSLRANSHTRGVDQPTDLVATCSGMPGRINLSYRELLYKGNLYMERPHSVEDFKDELHAF